MMLAGDSMIEFKAIKQSTVGEYIIKLDNYVTRNAPPDTMGAVLKGAKFKKP